MGGDHVVQLLKQVILKIIVLKIFSNKRHIFFVKVKS